MSMTFALAIPARMASTRFPGKPLATLGSKRVLEHVYESCKKSIYANNVYILTDSSEISDFAKGINANCIMTSPQCQNGTERIVEALDKISEDFIINVQGDEPFIPSTLIDSMIALRQKTNCDLITCASPIKNALELTNPNIVKVLKNSEGKVLYFSRSPLPFVRGEPDHSKWLQKTSFFRHIGIYGYSRNVLEKYGTFKSSALENCEMLEQLRFIDNGFEFSLIESNYESIGIDTPQDLENATQLLKTKNF